MDFPGAGQGEPMEQVWSLLVASGVVLAVDLVVVSCFLAVLIYYLITMSAALAKVSPENRDMEPGQVYLALIPCFNIVWLFFVVFRVASSLAKEFNERGIAYQGDVGERLGMLGCISMCIGCTPIWIVFGILHARRIKAYVRQLEAAPPKPTVPADDGYAEGY